MRRFLSVYACCLLIGPAASSRLFAEDRRSSPPGEFLVEPKTGIEFVFVKGGEFMMGSSGREADEGPPHRGRVGSFHIGIFEVTQRQWKRVMGSNPSHFKGCGDCPVEQVSWDDAREFMRRAGAMTDVPFRLPTEAEWEYAAGGGAKHQRWPGTDLERESGEHGWYSGSFAGKTRPVGLKLPNALGLYDMGGNVAEWCADWYGEGYYRRSPVDDPTGPGVGSRRVVRGGSWLSGPLDTRTARRSGRAPDTRSRTTGFRVVFDASGADRQHRTPRP